MLSRHTKPKPGARDKHDAPSLCAGYTLGLKGPQALLDTACSSALVAYGALVGGMQVLAGGKTCKDLAGGRKPKQKDFKHQA